MPRTSNSIYACVIRFLLSQKHIRQTRTDRTLQDGEEPSKNQVSKKNGDKFTEFTYSFLDADPVRVDD